tara:strand:+ start:2044 stop:2553 length:510 start_codon:yes stop_codon:yes gene_type:complete
MITPPDMTEQQVLEKIQLVVDRISPRYVFSGYDIDDIKQEAFIICVKALERYNYKVGPLENFLSINLSNRLKNFIRDNYYKKGDDDKKKVMNPSPLSYDYIDESVPIERKILLKEISSIVDDSLPSELRCDYLKLMGGNSIPKKRKLEIMEAVYEILKEHGYDETWKDI